MSVLPISTQRLNATNNEPVNSRPLADSAGPLATNESSLAANILSEFGGLGHIFGYSDAQHNTTVPLLHAEGPHGGNLARPAAIPTPGTVPVATSAKASLAKLKDRVLGA